MSQHLHGSCCLLGGSTRKMELRASVSQREQHVASSSLEQHRGSWGVRYVSTTGNKLGLLLANFTMWLSHPRLFQGRWRRNKGNASQPRFDNANLFPRKLMVSHPRLSSVDRGGSADLSRNRCIKLSSSSALVKVPSTTASTKDQEIHTLCRVSTEENNEAFPIYIHVYTILHFAICTCRNLVNLG